MSYLDVYDILVIGAGPIGSYLASRLAKEGFKVAIFEEDKEVGKNVICTGIIGKETFEKFNLPRESILNEIKSINFFSPAGAIFKYNPPHPLAYVVDREKFDKGLFQWAKKEGVETYLGNYVEEVKVTPRFCEVKVSDGASFYEKKAKVVILATGIKYKLHKKLGLTPPPSFLQGVQIETTLKNSLEETEIYIGRKVSPGSFAWAVPLGDSRTRIGILAKSKGTSYLEKIIQTRFKERLLVEEPQIRKKSIAYGLSRKTTGERVLAVGEAAGQVKTTTGGGIAYGLFCAEIAVKVLKDAFCRGRFGEKELRKYEKLWKSKLGKEIRIGDYARKIFGKFSDFQIEKVFKFVKGREGLVKLLEKNFDFEFHSKFLPLGIRVFKEILFR